MTDFTELQSLRFGDIALNRREHQVMAMYGGGFNDDVIIADYLGIKLKYVQAITCKLRRLFGLSNNHELARIYESAVSE